MPGGTIKGSSFQAFYIATRMGSHVFESKKIICPNARGGGGGGVLPYMAYILVCAGSKGMYFSRFGHK